VADFAQRLSERLGRPGRRNEAARERKETDEHRAEQLVKDWMNRAGWTEAELAARAKGDSQKAALAVLLRRETPDDPRLDRPAPCHGQRQLRLPPAQNEPPPCA